MLYNAKYTATKILSSQPAATIPSQRTLSAALKEIRTPRSLARIMKHLAKRGTGVETHPRSGDVPVLGTAARLHQYKLSYVKDLECRRGWDSNPARPFRFCNLQILRCRGCRECQHCRRALHTIARY